MGKSRFYLERRFMALQNNHREMLNYRLDLESVRLCGSIGSLPEPAGPTGQSTPGVPHCQVYPRLLSHGELRVSCETRCFLSVAATAPQGHPGRDGRVSGLRHNEVCRLTFVLSVGRFHPKHHRPPSAEWQDDGWCVWVVPL